MSDEQQRWLATQFRADAGVIESGNHRFAGSRRSDNQMAILVFKQFIAPKALGVASGENYLENAADRVKDILQQHNKPQPPFFIFGHNHEPDIVKVVSKYPLIWYVNTGSWLYSQGVIEEWLQQTKYHSFLKIIPGKIGAFPELRFWNATTKSGERIRLRQ
jgi:hypothetical protein